jgi:hypothetical protein
LAVGLVGERRRAGLGAVAKRKVADHTGNRTVTKMGGNKTDQFLKVGESDSTQPGSESGIRLSRNFIHYKLAK